MPDGFSEKIRFAHPESLQQIQLAPYIRGAMYRIIVILFVMFPAMLLAQPAHKYLRSGNKAYQREAYAEAEEAYLKSLAIDERQLKATYNLGNALFKQAYALPKSDTLRARRFEDASRSFERALKWAEQNSDKALVYYNQGTTYIEMGKQAEEQQMPTAMQYYQKAVEALKSSLRLVPGDLEAKHNLAYALKKLRQQQEQQQEQEQNKQDQENQEDKDQESKDKQEQDKQQNKQEDSQNQDAEKPEDEQSGAQAQKESLSKEEARRLLQIIENEDKKAQQKMLRAQEAPNPPRNGKDW